MKGIIFDFNGTMFQDSHLHELAWTKTIKKYSNKNLNDEDILHNIHGRTNKAILTFFISKDLSDLEIEKLSQEKEAYYRSLCVKNGNDLKLTDGLIPILDKLKNMDVQITIATATIKENVDFYFEIFKLGKWFNRENVVYDNGSFPGKPEPDIFILAAKKLGLDIKNCTVIEDAFSGLQAATKANVGKIIAIDPLFKNRDIFKNSNLNIDKIITDFTELKTELIFS